jgi:hypothetical protein
MKFFTHQRLASLQSGDAAEIASALSAWDASAARYSRHLESIRPQLAAGAVDLVEQWSFHDEQLLNVSYQDGDKLSLILRQQNQLQVLTFVLVAAPTLVQSEHPPAFASAGLLWLYEELDLDGGATVIHILLSDGSELIIPFAAVSVQPFDVHPRPKQSAKSTRRAPSRSPQRRSGPGAAEPKGASVLDRLTPVIPPLTRPAPDVKFPIVIRTRRNARANGSTNRR